MAFTEYKFNPTDIKALVAERTRGLEANKGFNNLLRFGLGVISERLEKDKRRYRDYGPYWPAVKLMLTEAGYALGEQSDPLIAQAYKGESPVETLIMADEFRTQYLATTMIYSNQFVLDGDTGETWTLYDSDMESAE